MSSGDIEAAQQQRTMVFDDDGQRAVVDGDDGMVLHHRGDERGVWPKENQGEMAGERRSPRRGDDNDVLTKIRRGRWSSSHRWWTGG
jgi:hypothetical protein